MLIGLKAVFHAGKMLPDVSRKQSKVLHAGFFEFLFAEKQNIVIQSRPSCHPFYDAMAFFPAVPVNHGIEIVLPVPLGRPLITVGHLAKSGQDAPSLRYAVRNVWHLIDNRITVSALVMIPRVGPPV